MPETIPTPYGYIPLFCSQCQTHLGFVLSPAGIIDPQVSDYLLRLDGSPLAIGEAIQCPNDTTIFVVISDRSTGRVS